ncbi:MAG: gluconate 2-dehydrogenase subunit 3 family protein [Candidatus Nitrosotenuis sp.]|nr:gluconate 2-dehydrogenase subunit 3 family protein [Candidatus Nitrosotenuis sp.]
MRDETTILKETLKEELDRLQKKSGINSNLEVLWIPKIDSTKEGEVIGNKIYIYSTDFAGATETLLHEFIDAMISRATTPYLDLINALLSVISQKAYQKKEDVVESLVRMLRDSDSLLADASSQKNLATV